MKKLILLIIIMFVGIVSYGNDSYQRPTKHKTVKYMKKGQVKRATKEKTMYFRTHKGKMVKSNFINRTVYSLKK